MRMKGAKIDPPKRLGGSLISRIGKLSGRIFSRLLKDHGIGEINPAQGRILFALWRGDGIPIRELSSRTGLEKSTLTTMLDRLERDGMLTRSFVPEDRRVTLISLTDGSREVLKNWAIVSGEIDSIWYKGFSESEILGFEAALERVFKNLQDAET